MSVQIVKCPEISFSRIKENPSTPYKGNDKIKMNNSGQMAKQEIREFMGSIQSFAAITSKGMEKSHHKDDILTKLGVPPPKEQKVPFK